MPVSRCSNAKPVTAATALTCAAVLTVALGGCRGPETPSSVAAKTRATSTASAASATTSYAGSAAPRTAPLPTARPTRPCATTDLAVSAVSHQVKQGLEIERFAVTTANPAGCTLTGPPDLRPKGPLSAQVPGATVDLAVSQLPVPDSVELGAGSAGSVGGTVPLSPGGSASFYLAWYSASPIVCVQGDGFGFNAPGDTSYSDMKPVDYDLGPVCDGIFYVSPVF